MNCKEAIPMIHDALDGELEERLQKDLRLHLQACGACRLHFRQLEQTDALVRSAPNVRLSDDITDKIMNAIPRSRAKVPFVAWIRRHPAISVAAIFFVVMLSSYLSLWSQDTELVVKGNDLDQLEFQGDTVVVPAGHRINGDLMVENGKIQVDGEVDGNLVVVDGHLNMASTAVISGQVTHIDKALDWLWYKMNQWFVSVAH